MSTFVSRYLQYTKEYESPTSFWKWSAYSIIGAVLRDSIYRRQGDKYLYPNIYVLLLAESSVHRKGWPVDLAEILISHSNSTKLVSGSTSIQALVEELARVETDPNTGKLKRSGSGIFLAQELSAALVEDPRAIKILTDIYDYKPMGYSVRLISRANSKVDRLVFSMFVASNEPLLKDLFNNAAIYGGLLARTFLILPDEFRESNSLWKKPNEEELGYIKKKLIEIANLKGEMEISQVAMEEYDNWYKPFRMSYKEKNERSGVVGRIHTGVLKLAMILAANDLSLCIEKKHIEESIVECMKLLPNYRTFIMSTGASRNKEEMGAFILETMIKAKDFIVSRRSLLQQPIFIQPDGAELLDKMMATLENGGIVKAIISSNMGDDTRYQLTPRGVEIMKG